MKTLLRLMILCGLLLGAVRAASGPIALRVSEGFEDPIGFFDPTPTLSWKLPAGVMRQTAYRVVVASSRENLSKAADLWDSGKVESAQSAWVPYAGQTLNSRQAAYWQVKFWDELGKESDWSSVGSFELGLLKNSDWAAQWIYQPNVVPERKPVGQKMGKKKKPGVEAVIPAIFVPEYFRREFEVTHPIKQARLYVTAKGLYEVYLNGKRVGEDYMVPGYTPYQSRIETVTYDVTTELAQGKNALGAILGEGWYAGGLMRKQTVYPDAQPMLLLQLELTLTDGTTLSVLSDANWKVTNNGPLRFSEIYDGEAYDARKELGDWSRAGYDASDWVAVASLAVQAQPELVPKRHHPTRIAQELYPVKITEPEPGRFIFDLGQNMVGWPELTIPVEKDQPITVRYAEMLQKDGRLYTENYRSAKSTNTYVPAQSGTITWHPTFTFHGFRYVELSGLPANSKPELSWVTGKVLHSDFSRAGGFSSSHEKLNRLQQNITWGQRGNYLDIPTDCPQRNERLGWTGDAQVFCSTAFFNYDVHAFWASWLQSCREEQNENGYLPNVVPATDVGSGSPGWGDVAVVGPWDVYVQTGDINVLVENYDMMKAWTEAYVRESNGFISERKGYGDWLQPHVKDKKSDTDMSLIATAYFGRCARTMMEAATVLRKPDEAKRYGELLQNIRSAFTAKFFDGNGKLTTKYETQTGYLMALGFDLLAENQRAHACENLQRLIAEAIGHLRTGFLGTPLILSVLSDEGHADLAYGILFKETYPGWFYSINQGATTMWERWNSYSHEDGFGDAGMNSFNHYAYGAVGQWLYESVAGLTPDPAQPGYKHFFIRPTIGGPLTQAKAELTTPYGKASSGWEKKGAGLLITAVVPPNTTATFVLPDGSADTRSVWLNGKQTELEAKGDQHTCHLLPGTHRIEVKDFATE